MVLRLVLRVIAVVLAACSVYVFGHAVQLFLSGDASEDWQRFVARLCGGLILLAGAPSLWRLPGRLPERRRRRLYELVWVMARPELLAAWQETSPSVKVLEALLGDFRDALAASRRPDTVTLFDEDEKRELEELDAEIRRRLPALPLEADEASQFDQLESWVAIRTRAAQVLERLTAAALRKASPAA